VVRVEGVEEVEESERMEKGTGRMRWTWIVGRGRSYSRSLRGGGPNHGQHKRPPSVAWAVVEGAVRRVVVVVVVMVRMLGRVRSCSRS
jgi:hypothetical protein